MLREDEGQDLRQYLIETAARLIGQRGTSALSVRDIAGEARVADGVLYNYFEDKEDLLAHAMLVHVGTVMTSVRPTPPAGTGTVAENLRLFIDLGLDVLSRVTPAFAGLSAQPKVLARFHALAGGDEAFGAASSGGDPDPGEPAGQDAGTTEHDNGPADLQTGPADPGPHSLPEFLTAYLRDEQRLGRIDAAADVEAASMLIVGAIHGQVLPRLVFNPPGEPVPAAPPGLAERLAQTVLTGIAPRSRSR